jgi:replication factor A1
MVKISELSDGMKRVSVIGKIGQISDIREVKSRFKDEIYRIADATIIDETGSIKLTLWNEQISAVSIGDNMSIENGYVTSFKGESQLNVGKFGKLGKVLA